jgi:FkbM family methyltransferase
MLKKLIRKVGLLKNVSFGQTINIKGQKIKIPVILELSCNLTETWMLSLLENLLKEKEGAFLDIGVNLGQTLIKVKGLESMREYIGFEPNPVCVFYVKELIKNNKFENCTIVPVGLFTEDNVLSLECISNSEVDSSASLIKDFRPGHVIYHKILVPVFRFQSIANVLNIDKVGIVKIDVEGAELEVVKSLYQTFQDYRPIIVLEVLPVYSDENIMRKQRQEELEQIFSELDYVFFIVEKMVMDTFMSLRRIPKIGVHSNLNQCDYVVVPNELVARIGNLVEEPANNSVGAD